MRLFVVITRDREGGTHHIQLRSRKAATIPDMQSRKEPSYSAAIRTANRLFGDLNWITKEMAGLDGQPFVVAIAEIQVEGIRV